MSSKHRLSLLIIALIALVSMNKLFGTNPEPHQIGHDNQTVDCATCHLQLPPISNEPIMINSSLAAADPAEFRHDGVEMCKNCHNPDQGHQVGIEIDFPVPADLHLGDHNDITCLTCHYVHGNLQSETPQASFSFLDRVLNPQRLHRSYLLRINNSNGELCLACHNVNQGSKP